MGHYHTAIVRGLLLGCIGLVGCFTPTPQEGLPCAPGGGCPAGQSCGFDGLCRAFQAPIECEPACSFGQSCGIDNQCHDNPPGDNPPSGLTSCDGFEGEQCAPCGQWTCLEVGGQPQVTCARNDVDFPCDQGQTCDESLQCAAGADGCDYNGGNTTRSCSDCGIERCLADGTWSGECEADADACTGDTECTDTGAAGDYDSTWSCEEPTLAVCNIGAYDNECVYAEIPPDPVEEGTYWETSSGCPPDRCRRCTCNSDGQVSCDTCAPIPY